MWTLALETTTNQGSVALLRDGAAEVEIALEGRAYGSDVFRAVKAGLAQTGLRLEDVDLFAVADGPGSFTGVRVGLTAVKGFIEVLGKPAVAVSTLRAIAGPGDEPALAVLDAGRGEVYFGVYPEGTEGLETLEALGERLAAHSRRRAVTVHPQLREAYAQIELASPLLATAVGRCGLEAFAAGRVQNALQLDARYIRRSDAELFGKAR